MARTSLLKSTRQSASPKQKVENLPHFNFIAIFNQSQSL